MKGLFKKFRNRKVLRILLLVLVAALSSVGYLYYQMRRDRIFIDNSLVSAPIIAIAPSAPGKLTEMSSRGRS